MAAVLIRAGFWSGLNLLLLQLIRYLDHHFIVSETAISILTIPVGLINIAAFIYGFNGLRVFFWKTVLIALICFLNFAHFLIVWQSLHLLSGSMVN